MVRGVAVVGSTRLCGGLMLLAWLAGGCHLLVPHGNSADGSTGDRASADARAELARDRRTREAHPQDGPRAERCDGPGRDAPAPDAPRDLPRVEGPKSSDGPMPPDGAKPADGPKPPDGPKPDLKPDLRPPDAPKPPDGPKPLDAAKADVKKDARPPDLPKAAEAPKPDAKKDLAKPDAKKDVHLPDLSSSATWKVVPSVPAGTYLGVWGRDAETIVAVGQACLIAVRTGGTWTKLSASGCSYELHAVWGDGTTFIAVGANNEVVRITLAPLAAQLMTSGGANLLWTIWGDTSGALLAAGDDGVVLTSTLAGAGSWTASNGGVGNTYDLRDIWTAGTNALQVLAGKTGTGGPALFTRPPMSPSWTAASLTGLAPTSAALRSIFGVSASDVVVVGDQGAILRFNGSQWFDARRSAIPSTAILHGLWASGPSDYVAVGTTGNNACGGNSATGAAKIYRFSPSGNTALEQNPPVSAPLCAVWGTSATNVYAVGHDNTVLRYTAGAP